MLGSTSRGSYERTARPSGTSALIRPPIEVKRNLVAAGRRVADPWARIERVRKNPAMRSIFGLMRLDEGRVLWEGRSEDGGLARRSGCMPESRGLYPRMPVREKSMYVAARGPLTWPAASG